MYYLGVFSFGLGAGYAVDLNPNTEDGGTFAEATFGIGVPQGALFFAIRGINSDDSPEFEWSTMSIGIRFLLGKKK
ncbi:MAG: hypothetical protein QMC35_05060 [Polaribacter sp.]